MSFDFQADALYFQALENGVSFAIQEERILSPDFHLHFGARIKASIYAPHDCWKITVQFLHYHARTRAETLHHMWRLHMGLADLLLSRPWVLSSSFCLIPFWGLRYEEIRHKVDEDPQISMKNKFWGIGPEMGLEGVFSFSNWVELFLRSAFSLAFGKFYIHQDIFPMKFFDQFSQIQNVFETSLGIRLRKNGFYGQIAFELFLFPGQNQWVQFIDGSIPGKYLDNQGDLSLHGLSFGLGVDF